MTVLESTEPGKTSRQPALNPAKGNQAMVKASRPASILFVERFMKVNYAIITVVVQEING